MVATLAAALLTGCGADKPDKEPRMTPDDAYTATRAVVADVLEALQPGASETIGESDRNGPCGGPEGNDFTKIQASVGGEVSRGPADLSAAGEAVRRAAADRGWTAQVRPVDSGLQVSLSGDTGSGSVTLGANGTGEVTAQSTCLANPRSEDPFPDVQPRTTPS